MAENKTWKGKGLSLLFTCSALASILFSGCSHFKGASSAKSAFEKANTLFGQGSYQAALNRYERIGEEHPSLRERVLFELGIIHSYPENGHRNYQKAIESFQNLVKDYPDSNYRQNSQTMMFTINNVVLKDKAIFVQQTRIETLQQEIRWNKKIIDDLEKQIECLRRKYLAFVFENGSVDKILIKKEERRMTLFFKGEPLKDYTIALGGDPIGPKVQEGDHKTPEGTYTIESRNSDSRFHLALRLSYPNETDQKRARELGVSPGGDIMIHGLKEGFSQIGGAHAEVDWTEGCIAVTDEEIEEIGKLAPNGTVVEILP